MKKYFIFLFFGLFGGLLTLIGGLTADIQVSTLIIRTLIAVLLSSAMCFIPTLYISKSLFPDYDLFAKQQPVNRVKKPKKTKEPLKKEEKFPKDSVEASLIAAAEKNSSDEIDILDTQVTRQSTDAGQALNSEVSTFEGQLRGADSKELANLVRHSMNKG